MPQLAHLCWFLAIALLISGSVAHADWPEDRDTRSPDDYTLVVRAKETLVGNIVVKDAWKSLRGIQPSRGKYKGVWNWDAAFHAMAVSHWDPALAREQIQILFDKQLDNGALPDCIYESGKLQTASSKPPVMGWAIAVVDHRAPDDAFLAAIYPKLIKMGDFYLAERGGKTDGLFYYGGADVGWDSGWDTSIRWDNGYRRPQSPQHRLWAIDLNCYMVMHYRAAAYIAGRLNLPLDRQKWLNESNALAQRIEQRLWDDQLSYYVDRDRETNTARPALTPAAFMPLFIHTASAAHAKRMAELAADPQKFFPGMPTAAYDSPGFKSSDYWRGPAWLNTSYFALKGLKDCNAAPIAEQLRTTLLGWIKNDPATIWEYYDSRTGAGGGAKTFGWSCAFAIAFVDDWNNDNLTWLFEKSPPTTAASP